MFIDLARKYRRLLYANFKDGIKDQPELPARDHDHPNSDGDTIIVARMLPAVEALLEPVR